MPVQNQDAVDLEAAREELQAVLQSKAFRAAPTLAGLLSYLCEKRIAGDTSQIKEYSIGVDVFHRGPDFNQESDSIVRVEINRLRKRLAEYYAQEGASHRLRIGIPVGQYIPEFQTVAAPEPDESAKTVATVSPVTAPVPSRSLHLRLVALTAGSVVLLVGAVLVVFFVFWNRGPKPPATVLHPSPSAVAEPTIGLPPGDEIRILAGSPRSYVDHAGKLSNADTWFSGGTAVHSDVRHIDRTQDPSFYRSSRQGQFRYDIPLKPGVYELHLHFAETVYGPDNSGMGGEGSRLFSVRANGQPLLTRFDILADAGGGDIADDRVFTDLSPARDGRLHLEFAGEDGKDAAVSAIEILPGVRGRIRPVRILARENPYYSNDSQWWSPDNYFAGGQLAAYSDPVTGTDDPTCTRANAGATSLTPSLWPQANTRSACCSPSGTGAGISLRRPQEKKRRLGMSSAFSATDRRFLRISICPARLNTPTLWCGPSWDWSLMPRANCSSASSRSKAMRL